MSESSSTDNTASFAEAFFIANLLFVGVFYIVLWVLYFIRYKQSSTVAKRHISQTLIASSLSTIIFLSINVFILLTEGYASLTALFSLEVYFMLIVPVFLTVGILGFTKAIKGLAFSYPLIGQLSK
ncbi:MAG: hypothetical protein GQ547_08485 [Methylophaga sp.]|nr:hypothetical protein [Methylophaga sp.]